MAVAKFEIGKWYHCPVKPTNTSGPGWYVGMDLMLPYPLLCLCVTKSGWGDCEGWNGSSFQIWTFHNDWVNEIPFPANPQKSVTVMPAATLPKSCPFNAGDIVRVKTGQLPDAPKFWGVTTYSHLGPTHKLAQGLDYEVITIGIPSHGPEWFELKGNMGFWHPDWVDLVGKGMKVTLSPSPNNLNPTKPPPTVCKCDILRGCRCGAFKAEMLAKGKVKDPVMGFWRNK